MRAAILHEFKQPLALQDVAVPTPSADEVLIKVEACGVCHSDLSIAEGEWAQLKRLIKKPLIPGHEVVGRVVEKGSDVHHLQAGDRVLRTPTQRIDRIDGHRSAPEGLQVEQTRAVGAAVAEEAVAAHEHEVDP